MKGEFETNLLNWRKEKKQMYSQMPSSIKVGHRPSAYAALLVRNAAYED